MRSYHEYILHAQNLVWLQLYATSLYWKTEVFILLFKNKLAYLEMYIRNV